MKAKMFKMVSIMFFLAVSVSANSAVNTDKEPIDNHNKTTKQISIANTAINVSVTSTKKTEPSEYAMTVAHHNISTGKFSQHTVKVKVGSSFTAWSSIFEYNDPCCRVICSDINAEILRLQDGDVQLHIFRIKDDTQITFEYGDRPIIPYPRP